MQGLKQQFIESHAPGWTLGPAGTLICPHGNRCEDDLEEHGDCGCTSPMRAMGII